MASQDPKKPGIAVLSSISINTVNNNINKIFFSKSNHQLISPYGKADKK